MRTTKRFTPTVLARFKREGRGTGIYEDFVPWHRVSRGDPASSGRSHLLEWRQRFRELLSDGELVELFFAMMVPDLDDCTEQFPLTLEPSRHPLTAYGDFPDDAHYPGTLELAAQLGIKPPKVHGNGATDEWISSTDLLVVMKKAKCRRTAVAVAFKPSAPGDLTARTRQLLLLERQYWISRNVPWLLITPEQYDRRTALTLRSSAPWAIDMEATGEQLGLAARIASELGGHSLTSVIDHLANRFGEKELAQRALWQAIWRGILPIELRRGWRPHVPLKIISPTAFYDLNPIVSRRSAWI